MPLAYITPAGAVLCAACAEHPDEEGEHRPLRASFARTACARCAELVRAPS